MVQSRGRRSLHTRLWVGGWGCVLGDDWSGSASRSWLRRLRRQGQRQGKDEEQEQPQRMVAVVAVVVAQALYNVDAADRAVPLRVCSTGSRAVY